MKKDSKLKLEWSKDIKVLTKSVPASWEGGVEGGGGGGGGAVGVFTEHDKCGLTVLLTGQTK